MTKIPVTDPALLYVCVLGHFVSPVSHQICQFSVSRFLCMCHCFLSQDVEVTSPPDDSISCLAFSPPNLPGNFLIGGSWANDVSYS